MRSPKEFFLMAQEVYRKHGLGKLVVTSYRFILRKLHITSRLNFRHLSDYEIGRRIFADVLFINGCNLPHPHRYRVSHQREQLDAFNISSHEIYYLNIKADLVNNYRTFIFFRCPYTNEVGELIELAKQRNKTVIFDIDDLIIDTKYTDQIEYIKQMKKEDKENYDFGVKSIGKTLKLCDYAIVTTDRLAEELKSYIPNVFINRNVASNEMVKLSEEVISNKIDNRLDFKENSKILLGYFSGSITHNSDINLISPVLKKILDEFSNVDLFIVGLLDIPKELSEYKNRIKQTGFVDWKKLPDLISKVDINLVPLENTIFNEAKSENKWLEASLVKVPTVASEVGAFKKAIIHNETGILCKTLEDWYGSLQDLITNLNKRQYLAENAYKFVHQNYITIYTGRNLATIIQETRKLNIAFVLPSLTISGGVLVALKHCRILQNAGFDTLVIELGPQDKKDKINEGYEIRDLNIVSGLLTNIIGRLDRCVATLWSTMTFINNLQNTGKKFYLVQSFETDFYGFADYRKILANQTYNKDSSINYITISTWCEKWLKDRFNKNSVYIPNGINLKSFRFSERDYSNKIRILIEGDSESSNKNVDESFRIANQLDPNKYEIVYLSYRGKPKSWYRIDRFFHNISHDNVSEIYISCHILLKTSLLESFSYPPLEMMATGGLVVVIPNEGNVEYLVDKVNCLFIKHGDIENSLCAIELLVNNSVLRNHLIKNGLETAKRRDWDNYKESIVNAYS